jgi:predicted small metal-binding protein
VSASVSAETYLIDIYVTYDITPYVKTINCREAGFQCDYIVRGQNEEEVMKNGADHAIKEHGMKPEDITPEFKEKVKSIIRDG